MVNVTGSQVSPHASSNQTNSANGVATPVGRLQKILAGSTPTSASSSLEDMRHIRSGSERAEALAQVAHQRGTFGVGAVLLDNDKLIAEAANDVIRLDSTRIPVIQHTLHAEMQLLNWYGSQVRDNKPVRPADQLTVVTSLAPCLMCLSRLMKQGIGQIKYLADDIDAGLTERSAERYLPQPLAQMAARRIEHVPEEALCARASALFSETCHEIRARASGVDIPELSRDMPNKHSNMPQLVEGSALTGKGKTAVSEFFASYSDPARAEAAIISPDDKFTICTSQPEGWPEAVEYNLMRDLIEQWDALPEGKPALSTCVIATNQSFDIEQDCGQASWDILQSIGVLSSATEGAPLLVLTNQPLNDSAEQRIAALPAMCRNLKIAHHLSPEISPPVDRSNGLLETN